MNNSYYIELTFISLNKIWYIYDMDGTYIFIEYYN